MRARLAAHASWAHTEDRSARTAKARQTFADSFEKEVDPDGKLDPAERARRAANAKKAYYQRLAMRSVRARKGLPSIAPGRQAIPSHIKRGVVARDGMVCRYCGGDAEPLDFDHVIPVCQGGEDSTENLVVSCRPCNAKKAGRTPTEARMRLRPPGGAR